ncbi:MAG: pilus assembly protein TadG-related protein [Eubacteriales bacterium]|nr:pilus assembly protein TadG-related protein [Eubacteriales bacterium]
MIRLQKWLKRECGQSVFLVVISITLLCATAALVVDVGQVAVTQGQLQNAADAAALAAAKSLPDATSAKNAASQYAALNGVAASDTAATTPYNGNANKVEVVCKKTVQYTFARVIGLNSKVVSARAVAEKSNASGAFGYALFSGGVNSQMGLYTDLFEVTGSVHSNYTLQMNGNLQKISGNLESVSSMSSGVTYLTVGGTCQASAIQINGNASNINVPNRLQSPASVITMPNFSQDIKNEATAAGTAYMINSWENKVLSGNSLNVDSSIYSSGGIEISACEFTGQGSICAEKSIKLSGNALKSTSSSAVCIYSVNGDINIATDGLTIYGTLYAPNGTIGIYAKNITIYGRVVAKNIIITGSNVKIIAGSSDLNFLPGGTVSLCE